MREPRERHLATVLGWLAHASISAAALTVVVPVTNVYGRVCHHAVDLGRHLAVALFLVAASLAWRRYVRWGVSATFGALVALTVAIAWPVLGPDLGSIARRTAAAADISPGAAQFLLSVGAAQLLPMAWLATSLASHRRWTWVLFLGAAVTLFWLNTSHFPQQLPRVHALLGFGSALLLGGALAPAARRWIEPIRTSAAKHLRLSFAGLASTCIAATLAMFWPLPSSTRVDVSRWSATLLSPLLGASAIVPPAPLSLDPAEITAGYYASREDVPSRPPSGTDFRPAKPIVLLLTIDAVRADLLSGEYADDLPNLYRLAEQGTHFTNARSASAATVVSLATISTGKYFSQLKWTEYETDDWLPEDNAVHLAQRLTGAGVQTTLVPGARWQTDRFGMMRGFQSGSFKKEKRRKFVSGTTLTKRIRRALARQAPEEPLFLFCHYFDPHRPYNSGRVKIGTPFERYLSEVAMVDALVGKIWATLEKHKLLDRTYVIIAADHGEAFGEHGIKHMHAVNLYDELIRVPLIVTGPGVVPQVVDEAVSLVDLSPTILDIFGLETPGDTMGQSLVPYL
ncbi:MAG: sulfatase, partial [Nannocystaceae bacterium]|nr:sulfatase [Nannocystaceae bacterium]